MVHQFMSKIFHGPCKNLSAPFLHNHCTVTNEGRLSEDLSELDDFSTVIKLHYVKKC